MSETTLVDHISNICKNQDSSVYLIFYEIPFSKLGCVQLILIDIR